MQTENCKFGGFSFRRTLNIGAAPMGETMKTSVHLKKLAQTALSLLLVVTGILSIAVDAYAYNKAYRNMYNILTDKGKSALVLTGDGPTDMVNIALKLKGKKGADLGHAAGASWCGVFIQHCAYLAGQASYDGKVGNFGSYGTGSGNIAKQIKKKGGELIYAKKGACWQSKNDKVNSGNAKGNTSDAKPGDIVVVNWNGNSTGGHVELVTGKKDGTIYTIGGNSGKGNGSQTTVKTHSFGKNDKKIVAIVRPKYITPKAGIITIQYDTTGGNLGSFTENGKSVLKITSKVPSRSGYTFMGWSASPSSGETIYKAGQASSFPGLLYEVVFEGDEPVVIQTVKLYAVWGKSSLA